MASWALVSSMHPANTTNRMAFMTPPGLNTTRTLMERDRRQGLPRLRALWTKLAEIGESSGAEQTAVSLPLVKATAAIILPLENVQLARGQHASTLMCLGIECCTLPRLGKWLLPTDMVSRGIDGVNPIHFDKEQRQFVVLLCRWAPCDGRPASSELCKLPLFRFAHNGHPAYLPQNHKFVQRNVDMS